MIDPDLLPFIPHRRHPAPSASWTSSASDCRPARAIAGQVGRRGAKSTSGFALAGRHFRPSMVLAVYYWA